MPQHEMIPRDRGEDPRLDERSEDLDGADEDFFDDLNIVLTDE
ncbi:hypothetical protein [Streptacidiphilus neutrinimicus]|nr:hypothetical protein [Streptacidiphilus neutrinimicus]